MNKRTKLIAIGGGEIGRPDKPIETLLIDKEIVRLSGKKHPKLLFLPTASKDSLGYVAVVEKYFGKKLGCKVDSLLLSAKPSKSEIHRKIFAADIIYVGGGNTLHMIRQWKRFGLDVLLKQAWERGVVMSGLSAGAVCWFRYASSDSRMMTDPNYKEYIRVKCLHWFNATFSPHHIREAGRAEGLNKLIHKHGGVGLAVDDFAALEIIGDQVRIITSKPQAKVFKIVKEHGKVVYEEVPKNKFLPVELVFSK